MTDEKRMVTVELDKLLLLLDRTAEAFESLDRMGKAYDEFIKDTFKVDESPSNVIDLEKRRLNKDPNDIYNN